MDRRETIKIAGAAVAFGMANVVHASADSMITKSNSSGDDARLLRSEIRNVIEDYFYGADAKEPELQAACFAQDGSFETTTEGIPKVRGRANIAELFRKHLPQLGKTVHALGNMHVRIEGDRIESKCFAVAHIAPTPSAPVTVRGLVYEDTWVQESGHWMIAKRRHSRMWQFDQTQTSTRFP